MELTREEEQKIKSIFSMVDYGTMTATEALWELEQLINADTEEQSQAPKQNSPPDKSQGDYFQLRDD